MKKYKKTIIVALLFWIPLAIVIFSNSKDDNTIMKIVMSLISGPIVFFEAGVAALAVAALFAGSFYLIRNLEAFKLNEDCTVGKAAEYAFNCSYVIAFAILYYFTITNQQIFVRIYGGW